MECGNKRALFKGALERLLTNEEMEEMQEGLTQLTVT